MKLRIIAEGRLKSKPIRELVLDYSARIPHYFPVECIEVKNSESTLKTVTVSDFLVVCDAAGVQKTSEELASFIINCQQKNIKQLVFYIGGPDGVDERLKKKANFLLSLSRMTFPHELVRPILLEQIYRACTIIRGEAYHK